MSGRSSAGLEEALRFRRAMASSEKSVKDLFCFTMIARMADAMFSCRLIAISPSRQNYTRTDKINKFHYIG